jgi:ATP-dependent RNA helicase RhlE
MTFKELGIIDPILKALAAEGYTNPTPIQEQAIPILLRGKDLLGCAQTGTGKTAAFAIPILQALHEDADRRKGPRKVKALVVTPTRELAIQIAESFSTYGKFLDIRNTVIFGGVGQGPQTSALRAGVDVLIATPGRLLDLMNQGYISLQHIQYAVLDEADHMLDMGFIHDIKKIVAKLPSKRQSLFFSATMPPEIVELSGNILGNPERVTVKPEQATAEKVEQSVYFVPKKDKPDLLIHLLETEPADSTLIFSRTKHGADKIVRALAKAGINALAIHGNKSQVQRQKALGSFKSGHTRILVATDIAARGIDVEELSRVIQYDLPNVPETYVHRIGRTGRAKNSGVALAFCDQEEVILLRDIQRLIRQQIPVVEHRFMGRGSEAVQPPVMDNSRQQGGQQRTAQPQRQQQRQPQQRNQQGGGNNRQGQQEPRHRNRPRPNAKRQQEGSTSSQQPQQESRQQHREQPAKREQAPLAPPSSQPSPFRKGGVGPLG